MTRTRIQGLPQRGISTEELRPGDVLHSYIKERDEYVHSGICLSTNEVAHFLYQGGDIETPSALIGSSNRLDVYRPHLGIWTADRLAVLDNFARDCVGEPYDHDGANALSDKREQHWKEIHTKLKKYFEGDLEPAPALQPEYFCSQFIVSCFTHAGVIGKSAQVLIDSFSYSPEDLVAEPTFGLPIGYIDHKSSGQDQFQ